MIPIEDDPFNYGGGTPAPVPVNGTGIPINGNNPAGYMDLSYWQSRGVTPDQIFDENGQTRPGWNRTARGYEQDGASPPAVTGPPAAQTTTQSYSNYPTTYGGGGEGGGSGQFDYGRPMGNSFTPYAPLNYQKFSYGDFAPTNRDDLWNEQLNPGFKRSQDRLQKQIEGGAAYQGMLRSGMTFDRLGSILGNNEEGQFKAFDDRRFRDWGANRENQAGAWGMNLGVAERENTASNNFRFNTEKSTADDLLSRWQELVRSTTSLARPV